MTVAAAAGCDTNTTIRPVTSLKGARNYDDVCDLRCAERVNFFIFCYSELGMMVSETTV